MHSPDSARAGGSPDGVRVAVLGMNHESAPIEVREEIAFTDSEVPEVLDGLPGFDGAAECVLLSTCNRTEVYLAGSHPERALDVVAKSLDEHRQTSVLRNPEWTYRYTDADAVRHLFAVASGLDSLMVGEAQIFAQIKAAYELSSGTHQLGIVLNRLFQAALHVGKRARTDTQIGVGAVSISSAAAGLAEKVFDDLGERTALLVGAGETARLAGEHLRERGVGRLLIANRTIENAERLAEHVGGSVVPFEDRADSLRDADILISVTSAPGVLFSEEDVRTAMRGSSRRSLLAIDLAVPRDIDAGVGRFDNVFLYDVDALKVMVEQSLERRRREIPRVEEIIQEECDEILAWYETLAVTPIIQELLSQFDSIRQEQLDRYGRQFTDADRRLLDQFTRTLMNRILHQPLTRLRAFTLDDRWGAVRLDTVRELFGLEGNDGRSPDPDRDAR